MPTAGSDGLQIIASLIEAAALSVWSSAPSSAASRSIAAHRSAAPKALVRLPALRWRSRTTSAMAIGSPELIFASYSWRGATTWCA